MARGTTRYMCGTPTEDCTGPLAHLSAFGKGKSFKDHGSSNEAFRCHKKYLVKQGYKVVGARELLAPDGSGIRVLTKQSRFGAKMRPGKENRNMPSIRWGGVCISK